MMFLVWPFGCPEPEPPPVERATWEKQSTIKGSRETGFGLAVAYGPTQLALGLPLTVPARVVAADGTEIARGGDFFGSSIRSHGDTFLVGSLDAAAPVAHRGEIASISGRTVSGDHGWTDEARLWSLVSGRFDGVTETLIAGRVDGMLSVEGQPLAQAGTGELGHSLAACDLDADGDDDLVVGVPVPGEVRLYLTDDPWELDLGSPHHVFAAGGRLGHAVACSSGWVLGGAPEYDERSGRVVGAPVDDLDSPLFVNGVAEARLGASVSVRPDGKRIAVGAPGIGEVWVLRAEMR